MRIVIASAAGPWQSTTTPMRVQVHLFIALAPILTPPPFSTSGEGRLLHPPLWAGMGESQRGREYKSLPRPLLGGEGGAKRRVRCFAMQSAAPGSALHLPSLAPAGAHSLKGEKGRQAAAPSRKGAAKMEADGLPRRFAPRNGKRLVCGRNRRPLSRILPLCRYLCFGWEGEAIGSEGRAARRAGASASSLVVATVAPPVGRGTLGTRQIAKRHLHTTP
jgi:hypothetical protein